MFIQNIPSLYKAYFDLTKGDHGVTVPVGPASAFEVAEKLNDLLDAYDINKTINDLLDDSEFIMSLPEPMDETVEYVTLSGVIVKIRIIDTILFD